MTRIVLICLFGYFIVVLGLAAWVSPGLVTGHSAAVSVSLSE